MTIKQQGGIFGRNPTFNDVDVEGTLTVNGEPISDFGSMAQQDADSVNIDGGSIDGVTLGTNSAVTETQIDNVNINGNAISTTNTDGDLLLIPDGSGTVKVNQYLSVDTNSTYAPITIGASAFDPSSSGGGSSGGIRLAGGTAGSGNYSGGIGFSMQGASGSSGISGVQGTADNDQIGLAFFVHSAGTGSAASVEAAQFTYGKHLSMTGGGNVVMQSGSGIDFSATSGTGTSELLDDYEEGTWTPTFSAATGGEIPNQSGREGTYTKIGQTVFVRGRLFTSGLTSLAGYSGNISITGLPFEASGLSTGQAETTPNSSNYGGFSGSINVEAVTVNGSVLQPKRFTSGQYLQITTSDIGTAGGNRNYLIFSATYKV